jgi:Tol biopolymer transport system component
VATSRYWELIASPPTWSPDGKRIAYIACTAPYLSQPCEHQYGYDLYVVGADGSGKQRLTTKSGLPQCPAWSSAGILAFDDSSENVLAIVQAGGGLRTFAPSGCPVWAPGGHKLAVSTSRGVALMTAVGLQRTKIPVRPDLNEVFSEPVWSPDGRSLAIVGGKGRADRLYVVAVNGGGVRRLL